MSFLNFPYRRIKERNLKIFYEETFIKIYDITYVTNRGGLLINTRSTHKKPLSLICYRERGMDHLQQSPLPKPSQSGLLLVCMGSFSV